MTHFDHLTVYRAMLAASEEHRMPTHYRTDLTKHDRAFLCGHDGSPFGWVLYKLGTHLAVAVNPKSPRGVLKQAHQISAVVEWARDDAPEAVFFVWDGSALRRVTPEAWVEALTRVCPRCAGSGILAAGEDEHTCRECLGHGRAAS